MSVTVHNTSNIIIHPNACDDSRLHNEDATAHFLKGDTTPSQCDTAIEHSSDLALQSKSVDRDGALSVAHVRGYNQGSSTHLPNADIQVFKRDSREHGIRREKELVFDFRKSNGEGRR